MASIKVPHPLPSPSEDSEKLHKAFQGWGTDGKAIISILAHRNADQRRLISQTYEELFNKKLLKSLEEELSGDFWVRSLSLLSGDFWNAVKLWTTDPPERDASLCKEALKKKKADAAIIVEITCASSPDHLIAVRRAYCALYKHSLEEDIGTFIKGPVRKLLVCVVSSYRYDGEEVDEELVKSEAETLRNAIADNNSLVAEEDEVIRIVSTRSKSQLKATCQYYIESYGKTICKDLESCKDCEFATVLRTVIDCICYPEIHFSQVLRSSIEGWGTDEDALTRAIVTRAEIDMERIKEEYQLLYKTSLEQDVVGDTSGDYKDFLITLLGCGYL